ncbi:MAG: DUF4837 family protein [Bacteroidetes bacterium]|nr:DUF4837 family protein [Bacteroidota bacterium]
MMKSFRVFFPFVMVALIIYSCTGDKKTGVTRSSGKTAEMIVSTNSEVRWEGIVGETIRQYFNQDYEVLPQLEPLFEMAHIPLPKLESNKMFRAHHNIFIVNIDDRVSKATIEAKKDLWASPQRVIRITAPSNESFVAFFDEKKKVIYDILMQSEYERLIKTFHSFRDRDIMNKLKSNFGFTMEIPSGFYIATQKEDFMWIRKETKQNSQGLLIYTYDYVDTIAFDVKRILSFRDVMTEEFVPGPSEGSYMIVAEDYSPIISKRIEFNGLFAVETRGLWKLENDFMGGPFINYTFVDERTNKVVTIDGYVYAPNAPKRDLMIQMESLAHSLRFVN